MVAFRRFQDSVIKMFTCQQHSPTTSSPAANQASASATNMNSVNSTVNTARTTLTISTSLSSISANLSSPDLTTATTKNVSQLQSKNRQQQSNKNIKNDNKKYYKLTSNKQSPQSVIMQHKSYINLKNSSSDSNNITNRYISSSGTEGTDNNIVFNNNDEALSPQEWNYNNSSKSNHDNSPIITIDYNNIKNRSRSIRSNTNRTKISPVATIKSQNITASMNNNPTTKTGVTYHSTGIINTKNNYSNNNSQSNNYQSMIRNNSLILNDYHHHHHQHYYSLQDNNNRDKSLSWKVLRNSNNNKDSIITTINSTNNTKDKKYNKQTNTLSSQSSNNDHNKFSRYKPLPAINCNDNIINHNNSNNRKKLLRTLTYKVINPVCVKGPSITNITEDDYTTISPSLNMTSSTSTFISSSHVCNHKKNFECNALSSSQIKKRSKTIIIDRNNSLDNINKSMSDNNYHTYKIKSPNTITNKKEKFSKNIHGKRLHVKKHLIEAAEKVKEGQPLVDNAFWVEF